jgi:hypothetical protein
MGSTERLLEGLVPLTLLLLACRVGPQEQVRRDAAQHDPSFAAVQSRGAVAMGVNQFTSSHVFEPLADGGRIELQRDTDDSTGIAQIRSHMRQIATQFVAGDFHLPGFVHAQTVPGTDVMAAKRDRITYAVESLPRGAALRVRSDDPAAVQAIHEFLAFQRHDHHAPAHHDT